MNYYLEKMIELSADGVDFIEIGEIFKPFPCVYKSYTKEEFENENIIPKTGYRYWKIINGEKVYVD